MLLSKRQLLWRLCVLTACVLLGISFLKVRTSYSVHSIIDNVSSTVKNHYAIKSNIPRILWYKLGPKGLSADTRVWTDSCIKQNETYEYTVNFLTDDTGDEYVRNNFPFWMQLLDVYLSLSIPILKADLLRYLILYEEGGIWNDLDVSCGSVPISEWIPESFRKDACLVVGLEFDVGWGTNFVREFATWTIMAKPKSPHLLFLIEEILRVIEEKVRENGVSIAELEFDMIGDVVDLTGPMRLTQSIYKSLSTMLNETIGEQNVSFVIQPKMIGDVLVMPGHAFAAGSNKYGENFTVPAPLVTHHFAGTWKNDHGGEMGR